VEGVTTIHDNLPPTTPLNRPEMMDEASMRQSRSRSGRRWMKGRRRSEMQEGKRILVLGSFLTRIGREGYCNVE
jgi:hypothetical protein